MITERLMASGSWDLKLKPDTPRRIRDLITPFSMIALFPSPAPINQSDANILASARYIGIVHQPGPQLSIAGPGLAAWLGQDDISYDVDGTAVLPEIAAESVAGSTLNAWLDDIIIPGTPFARGTTGPSGTMKGTYQWVTPRVVLDAVAAAFASEWRIRNTLHLDVAPMSTLYGSTPRVVITRRTSGRDIGYISVDAQVTSQIDVSDFASRVVVLGQAGRGSNGTTSSYTGPEGTAVKAVRVISSPDIPEGAEATAAATYAALLNTPRREVRLSTRHYDVAGDIGVGELVNLHDPEAGIVDETRPIVFRGDVIRPAVVRVMGITWPWRRGMGAALRTVSGSTVTWTDLTPYIVPENSDAEIEIGAAQQMLSGDALSLRQDLQPRLAWAPWTPFEPTWASTDNPQPAIGNGQLTGHYRRLGSTVELAITMVAGTTTTFGAGSWAFILPNGMTGHDAAGQFQLGEGMYFLKSGDPDAVYPGRCFVEANLGNVWATNGASPWANINATTPFTWGATDSLNLSIRLQVNV